MDQQNAELEKRLEKLEQEFADIRKRLDELIPQAASQAVSKNEKKQKGKLFLRICVPVLILSLLAGGFFYYRTNQKPSYAKAEIGDIVTFGRYEQNNSEADGQEPIEWIVLDKQDGKILLLSRYVLDNNPYAKIPATWYNHPNRIWLNQVFYSAAFTQPEQNLICTTVTEEDLRFEFDKRSEDKVVLLTAEEVEKYMPEAAERICQPTSSAQIKVFMTDEAKGCRWVLKGKTEERGHDDYVLEGGYLQTTFYPDFSEQLGIRPALWLDIT